MIALHKFDIVKFRNCNH